MKRKGHGVKEIFVLSGLVLFLIPGLLFAQEFPTKPINMMVTFAAGGVTDVPTRVLVMKAEKFLGQPILVSNNGAGGGSVAMTILAKEKPDGYRLASLTSTVLIRVPQFRTVPYKLDDFVPIMHFGSTQTGLVVKANSPWKTLKEFADYAKKNPDKITCSIAGIGLPQHLAMLYLAKQEGIKWTYVPYPGGAPAFTAFLGGHVDVFSGGTVWMPHVKEGSLRLLATHGETRMKAFPNVPTFRELGYDVVNETVLMIAAPKGTPPAIVKKLDEAFRKSMDDPDFVRAMENMESEVYYRNSEDTKKYLEEAYVRIGKMIKEFNIPKESEKK